MARKLKTFQTSLGFYDLAVAAPSMKAALEAWGAGSNLFHQGFAKETDDPEVVAATMSKPGVVLKRPAGSNGSFAESSDLPDLGGDEVGAIRTRSKAKKRPTPRISESAGRNAALEFEREQKRREAERLREEASRERERERREKAVAKAQAALDEAREAHEARASAIDAERAAVDKKAEDESSVGEAEGEAAGRIARSARIDGI